MLKGKQKKHAVVEAVDASGKISRKQFEGHSQTSGRANPVADLVQRQGGARHCGFRGPGHGR